MTITPIVSCREVVEVLWEYIDGELTEERMEVIRAHLIVCERCYPHYDFQKAFVKFVRRHGADPAPVGLRRKVFQMILEEKAGA